VFIRGSKNPKHSAELRPLNPETTRIHPVQIQRVKHRVVGIADFPPPAFFWVFSMVTRKQEAISCTEVTQKQKSYTICFRTSVK
jgi:hypothetical protein